MNKTNQIYAALQMLAKMEQTELQQSKDFVLCSDCFRDRGLRHDAARLGTVDNSACPNCGSVTGQKLDPPRLNRLVHGFFVWGTLFRCEYGAAPRVVYNKVQQTSINVPPWLTSDIHLIEKTLGVGFFYYGPRLWMIGEVEPLKTLQDQASRPSIIARILSEYPTATISPNDRLYRLRKDPARPSDSKEYDSQPNPGKGRLDSPGLPVMYGSQDLQICIHECRVTAEDNLFVATLQPSQELKLLDLAHLLDDKKTEFESLDMAVHMLFLAGEHAYPIARDIAIAAQKEGFDGLVYPSYFSLLRIGGMPFETVMGISTRKIPSLAEHERAKSVRNLAIFGRPVQNGIVAVACINKLILHKVEYGVHFGPAGVDPEPAGVDPEPANAGGYQYGFKSGALLWLPPALWPSWAWMCNCMSR